MTDGGDRDFGPVFDPEALTQENRGVSQSVIEAIREGEWDFEPTPCSPHHFQPTQAIPGSAEKVSILCERISRGQPLWHPQDRRFFTEYQPPELVASRN